MREISIVVGRSSTRRQTATLACPFCLKFVDFTFDAGTGLGSVIAQHLSKCPGNPPGEIMATASWPDRRKERWHLRIPEATAELVQ